jgi:outer membrane protein assembly factor BamB
MTSEILFTIIRTHVYKEDAVREISRNSRDKEIAWMFDFKSQALSKKFLEEYARCFWEVFGNEKKVQIGGMESGAIPLITGVSLFAPSNVQVQSFYIRKSRKKSDLANLIEGEIDPNVPIVLVDDILNKGRTTRKQLAILEERGYKVSAVFTCIRFYDVSAYQEFIDKGIKIVSIFELNDFSSVLPVKNKVEEENKSPVPHYVTEYRLTLTNKPNLYLVLPKSGPVLKDDYIYMGVDDGTFYCITKQDGSIVWTYKVMFGSRGKRIFSTPVVYKDVVMFGAYDGNLYCLDRFTGKRRWVFTDADWIGSSPSVDEGRGIVFVGLEFGLIDKRGGVVAVDITSGKALWKNYTMTGLTHASPAFNKKHTMVVCGCNDNHVYAFNAKNGDILWKYETKGTLKYGALFDDSRNFAIIAGMDGGVYVLHMKDGSLYHRFEARFGFYATPVLVGDKIIIGSLDKLVYCYNLVTKKTDWTFETFGRIFASPAVHKKSVFIGSNDGRLYEIDIESGKNIAVVQFSERIVNRIVIDSGTDNGTHIQHLYVATHVGELYKLRQVNDWRP